MSLWRECSRLRACSRLRPIRGRQTRIKYVIGLTGLAEVFRHSWYQSKMFEMADRRDWGGGGDDPEESTQRMIERIWESLTDIQRRMDQQAPVPLVAVPPGDGETVPVAPVLPGVEVITFLKATSVSIAIWLPRHVVFVVLGACPGTVCTIDVFVVFLDTLTPHCYVAVLWWYLVVVGVEVELCFVEVV
ncbi:hypothetical protein Taro_044578 [Colocasia esculenta]|uniref:Uncharacterized protein n=1 Tax=Colocasia esculenta TaxID=4460 RepID=A0A843WUD7_COLES|nr:hypothetical protein [Colocasia esculenta]